MSHFPSNSCCRRHSSFDVCDLVAISPEPRAQVFGGPDVCDLFPFTYHMLQLFLSLFSHPVARVFIRGGPSYFPLWMCPGDVRFQCSCGFVAATAAPASPYIIRVGNEICGGVDAAAMPVFFDAACAALPHERTFGFPRVRIC